MPESRHAILSIQSDVVYGHVGNGAARFALQRLGFEVWALPTILLSNHPGHKKFRGDVTAAQTLRALLAGLAENSWLKNCAAVLSGYLGGADQTEIVAEAVTQVKSANPEAIYLCDPVFGDDGGAYARPGVAEAIARRLIPLADIIAPNRFELASLTARRIENAVDAVAAARTLGGREILVTSIPFGLTDIGTLVVTPEGATATKAPKLPDVPNGTGDLLSALYLAARLNGLSPVSALGTASSATHAAIVASVAARADELALIAVQDQLRDPLHRLDRFPITP